MALPKIFKQISIPLGSWLWSPLKKIPFGFLDISKDNGLLSRAAFPQLWETIKDDGNVVSESAWQESVAQFGGCGSFSSGDGSTTFRLPMIAGLYARAYDPAKPNLALGKCLGDAIRNITGAAYLNVPTDASGCGHPLTLSASGSFYPCSTTYLGGVYFTSGGTITSTRDATLGLNASLQVPTANENRPKTVCQTPIMKVYGVATDAGEANIAQLIAATAGKLDTAVYENNGQYSTSEVATGKRWTDGKMIYRKIINLGTLPNNTTKTVATNISNVSKWVSMLGMGSHTDGTTIWLNTTFASTNDINLYILSTGLIGIITNYDRSGYTGHAILEYTCTDR